MERTFLEYCFQIQNGLSSVIWLLQKLGKRLLKKVIGFVKFISYLEINVTNIILVNDTASHSFALYCVFK